MPPPPPDVVFRFDFACVRCGQCCRFPGNVLLTDDDITRLAVALAIPEDQFIAEYTRLASNRRQLSLQDRKDGGCLLLAGDACSVYEARPEQCRRFPFPTTTRDDCPGLQVGVAPPTRRQALAGLCCTLDDPALPPPVRREFCDSQPIRGLL